MKFLLFALLFVFSFQLNAQLTTDHFAPESSTGTFSKKLVKAKKQMVVAANPHASKAGIEVLRKGGSAVDAAIAVQLVLGLVEPQSSGIGGGGFMLHYEQKTKNLIAYDGRETSSAKIKKDHFFNVKSQSKPMGFWDAVVGAHSVGTPSMFKLLDETHKKHGKLPWKDLFGPAIELAEKGFRVSPRLAKLIQFDQERLKTQPVIANYLLKPDGSPKQIGEVIKNPEYAQTLKGVAEHGIKFFYEGKLAKDIVRIVTTHPQKPGILTLEDLKSYKIKSRESICSNYRTYKICGMPPPSSGGITVGMILGILENVELGVLNYRAPETWRLIGEASRLAYADRGVHLSDPDFYDLPTAELLDRDYLKKRFELIPKKSNEVMQSVKPGKPLKKSSLHFSPNEDIALPSTSHFSIVDREGNVVSMTSSVENVFGSRVMVGGFVLNNQLTDFSFSYEKDGKPIKNAIGPLKRPLSSMSPTIIFDKSGNFYGAIGSPGGSRIILYVVKTLIAHFDWKMDIQTAIEFPHLMNRFGTYDLEKGTWAESFQGAFTKMGYKVNTRDLNSGLHAIVKSKDGYLGGADERREGLAIGD